MLHAKTFVKRAGVAGFLLVVAPEGAAAQEPVQERTAAEVCCRAGDSPKSLFQWSLLRDLQSLDDEPDAEDEPLVTDRPDFTEASSTVGLGRVQLEFGYTFTHNDDDGQRTNSHAFGEQLWRIGMLAEWLELRLGWNYFLETTNTRFGRDETDGADDLYVGFKVALTEQAGWRPEMALIPQAFVPTGSGAFTSDEFLPGLNWVYSWEISECLSIAGSTQGNRTIDDTGASYTEFAQSVTAGYSLTDRLGAYTEWFALFPHSAEAPGVGVEHYLNGGFTFLVHNDLQLDIRVGFGLNDRADDVFTGAGFSRRW